MRWLVKLGISAAWALGPHSGLCHCLPGRRSASSLRPHHASLSPYRSPKQPISRARWHALSSPRPPIRLHKPSPHPLQLSPPRRPPRPPRLLLRRHSSGLAAVRATPKQPQFKRRRLCASALARPRHGCSPVQGQGHLRLQFRPRR